MSLYDQLFNITNETIEPKLEKAIQKTKEQLKDLTEERTCLIYHSYLYRNLKEQHLLSHLISTSDLGMEYQHYFILIKQNDQNFPYLLADLTYRQFLSSDPQEEYEKNLLNYGYSKMNNEEFQKYWNQVSKMKEQKQIDLDKTFLTSLEHPKSK